MIPKHDQPVLVRPLILHDFSKSTYFKFPHNSKYCPFGPDKTPPTLLVYCVYNLDIIALVAHSILYFKAKPFSCPYFQEKSWWSETFFIQNRMLIISLDKRKSAYILRPKSRPTWCQYSLIECCTFLSESNWIQESSNRTRPVSDSPSIYVQNRHSLKLNHGVWITLFFVVTMVAVCLPRLLVCGVQCTL